ncbi:MAG: cystathionine gamma-synthase [Xanthomonadales bacterium]|nr:cystathionine gamma-synthase [Xanthomonadales bacterium]
MRPAALATVAVRGGIDCDAAHGAVTPPLHLSSTFSFECLGQPRRYDYGRSGNPTRDLLAETLTELEGGAGAVVTASGLAAVTTVLALLGPDDLLVAPHDGYGGCWRLFTALARRGQLRLALVDQRDPTALAAVLAQQPRLLWLETPSNPLLRLVDIAALAQAGHAAGALVCVDNTFLSPALQRPLALGADLVVHSTTKYLNGHSDVVGGAVVAADAGLAAELAWWANALGLTGSPFDSLLTLRGLRTLAVRLAQHQHNAEAVARRLADAPGVAAVHWPGLARHPDHALALRQQHGPGAIVSIELADGEPAVRAFLEGLRCFTLAESLGGVESLIAHPATMTHAAMSEQARTCAGIGPGLLRLSVGIEDARDLLADLDDALARVAAVAPCKEAA